MGLPKKWHDDSNTVYRLGSNLEHRMASTRLEQRVAALEAAVARLKSKLEERETSKPWWEQIVGTLQNDPIYDHAMQLGQQYRRSLRPRSSPRRQQ
jgi:uncharacterized small protein (DUF1192 family)